MAYNDYLLEMKDICKYFPGVKALDNAKLLLKPGSVHALMGENGAGKSTLMKCLFGIYREDAGEIYIEGQKGCFNSPKEALEHGVSMVHQELNQVSQTTVMENIWLGRFPKRYGMIDDRAMYEKTKAIFEDLQLPIDPRKKVGQLSVSQCQMVEIAKAVSYDAKIIVMDEPTSSLTEKEVDHLFRIINQLKARGCGIIYISHKMEEILKICDDVTVMRDGQWIATEAAKNLTTDKIIALMVGRDLTDRFPEKHNKPGDVVLKVENLTAFYKPTIEDVTFELREGEILGVAGLMGSRRTELVETILGIRKKESGHIFLKGREIDNKDAKEAIKNGFALLTEDRRKTGIFDVLDITFNTFIANINQYTNWAGVLDNKAIAADTERVIESMRVKTPSTKELIRSLSGGNQQKVLLGRWLLTEPEILMLDEPTRGIDVGAKYEIYQLMINLAQKGRSIIMISSELPELLGITDRIIVMSNGRVAGIVETKATNQEEILGLAAKYL